MWWVLVRRRIFIIGVVFLFAFGLVFLQLNNLQVIESNKLTNEASAAGGVVEKFSLPRGSILTSDGQIMAETVPSKDVYHYQRVYPNGSLYANITGYYSLIYGVSGLEAQYNQYLSPASASTNSLTNLGESSDAVDSVVTTVSSVLQAQAYRSLGSLKGSVVALNPRTGAILALASNPTYNPAPLASPNTLIEESTWKADLANPLNPLLDRAISRSYPPGSTFKIVVSSAIYDMDPSLAKINFPSVSSIALPETTHRLHNYDYESCGGTLPALLAVSCDTGFAQLGLRLGAARLVSAASAFGFNQVPPIDIPGAAASTFPPLSFFNQNLPQLAFSSIGQGDDAGTPLQMALVASAIANHGDIMTPHLLEEVVNAQDKVIKSYTPTIWKHATSPSTATEVGKVMEGVVEHGTATDIAIPGIKIAAKTGTAQINLQSGASLDGRADNWMIAFAPVGDPKIAIAVSVPYQPGLSSNPTGAQYAGPIVKAMIAKALGVPE
jgi:peptidoglycan glycosyltransferase